MRPALASPLHGNPLRTRADVERAFLALFEPLLPYFSEGGARVKLGSSGVFFSDAAEELEGYARPLWGIVPYALGGGSFAHWELYRRGLVHGSDPDHPEFWGFAERDQRMVEMAAIGFALAFVPEHVWEPLPGGARDRLVAWLDRIDRHPPHENNWQFFRVLVNLGLARVGRKFDRDAQRDSLDRIDSYYLRDGFYQDGPTGHVDYYVPWALHAYGLVYAASRDAEPERAARFRERARAFAPHFRHWFDPRGAAIPFGRSLTYRFAQAAFWGALVLAGEEALPWGVVKGLYLRNLRDWARRPICDRDGVLSLGYGYANLGVVEPYSSACSPYWAMKAFLALAAPASHPFWTAEEVPLEPLAEPVEQPEAGFRIARTATHAVALSGGQTERFFPNGPHKYAKLAYSSYFGFSVGVHETRPHMGCHDSMLALRAGDEPWRVRESSDERRVADGLVYARWSPWPDVRVETVLAGGAPWHVRVHRLTTPRPLWTLEGGFALGWDGHEPDGAGLDTEGDERAVRVASPYGASGIRSLAGERRAAAQPALPNTNLVWPRTVVPVLHGEHAAGTHLLACAVWADDTGATEGWSAPPSIPDAVWDLLAERPAG